MSDNYWSDLIKNGGKENFRNQFELNTHVGPITGSNEEAISSHGRIRFNADDVPDRQASIDILELEWYESAIATCVPTSVINAALHYNIEINSNNIVNLSMPAQQGMLYDAVGEMLRTEGIPLESELLIKGNNRRGLRGSVSLVDNKWNDESTMQNGEYSSEFISSLRHNAQVIAGIIDAGDVILPGVVGPLLFPNVSNNPNEEPDIQGHAICLVDYRVQDGLFDVLIIDGAKGPMWISIERLTAAIETVEGCNDSLILRKLES